MPPSAIITGPALQMDERPLHALLDASARDHPDAPAFRFLNDGETDEEILTYGGLARRSRVIAAGLIQHGAGGKTVLLVHPPGLGFIEGLFACWHAGAIAVPSYPPLGSRHRQRLQSVQADCAAEFALVAPGTAAIAGARMLESESLLDEARFHDAPATTLEGPCLLQYTSGSTASPKGVMISHRNFRSHFASLRCYESLGLKSAVSWLPPYHDMGLVLKILYAFEARIPLTFFSPDHFIQRPVRWLRAISNYRAELSGAPNFAFEACLRSIRDDELEGIDLSCWKAAPCGAERIRPDTLERFSQRFAPYGFRPEAFRPGYGLAETTLIVTACQSNGSPRISQHPTAGRLVSSGSPLPGVTIRIVDPLSSNSLPEGMSGEIHVKGPVVSEGYWNHSNSALNHAELATGDLGYLENGELFVTGRIKDLIIIDGSNHSPEDIEGAAFSAVPQITAAAAFSMEAAGRESVTLAVEAASLPADQRESLCTQLRRTIGDALEIPLHRVVIVRSGLLPRTTSGKIRRGACREALAAGTLKLLHDDQARMPIWNHDSKELRILLEGVTEVTGRGGATAHDDVIGFGMSSLDATRLAAWLRAKTGVAISLGEIFAARSFAELADFISTNRTTDTGMPRVSPDAENPGLLTHSQERMWFLHQFDPSSAAYHVFGAIELNGPLALDHLRSAFSTVVSRHEILRSRHGSDNGRPHVRIEPSLLPDLDIVPITSDAELAESLTSFATTPFDLASDSPIRATLFDTGAGRRIMAVCAHHIAADGWSMRILAGELADEYAALLTGVPQPSKPAGISYAAFAACHRRWVDGGAVDPQIAYWKNRLAGHPGVLQLPVDFPRPIKPSADGGLAVRVLPASLCNRIAGLARNHRATPFMVHLAAFLLLLRQHGAGSDLIVAVPVANRNHADAANLIGTLVNTLPFRLAMQAGESFASLLERVREASFEMQANQDAPFERIIEAIKPDRSSGHAPLAQVMFDHQEIPITAEWPGGLQCKPFITHRGAAQFDLSLLLTVFNDHQQLSLEYRKDLFLPETVTSMLDRHLATLEAICANPRCTATEAIRLTHMDREWLTRHSQGPARTHFPTATTPALIARRTGLHRDRKAVCSSNTTISYHDLEERSDRLAAALIGRGIRPGDRTAVLLERDGDLPVALLAIWKAGAAYVPLDRSNPAARLQLILADQAPLHVLVSPDLTGHLPAGADIIEFTPEMMQAARRELTLPAPHDAAYVIYTSGSTGKPKGVVVSHGALANFLLSMAETPGFTEADHLLAVTTVSFDISTLEIFLPLITGGSVELVSTATARDGHALLERLHASRATVMQATPATWRLLLDAGWKGSPDLKILCGGEAMDLPLARTLASLGGQLWNLYGPTETTVWSTHWRVPHDPLHVRIGTPIANTGVHITDEDGSILPPGVPGQLWISGDGLAAGYWRQPDLTEQRFATLRTHDGQSVRAYQTGDIARWHPDGTLECLGRCDGQVKIRGFRVELGEIEEALAAHPLVAIAKVALRGDKLVAWITTTGENPSREALRDFLSDRLPVYMLPSETAIVDAFPLNSNGKIDVSQLPNPECSVPIEVPVSDGERRLIAIWSELLGKPTIHPEDNWFHIGGHSLLALRLFARIHQDLGRSLPLSAILDHPTPRALAEAIEKADRKP